MFEARSWPDQPRSNNRHRSRFISRPAVVLILRHRGIGRTCMARLLTTPSSACFSATLEQRLAICKAFGGENSRPTPLQFC
jgi:hypothetical protein